MADLLRNKIIEQARTFLGTPFHHQGRVKGVGIDCLGLLTGVADALGYSYEDCEGYRRLPDGHSIIEYLDRSLLHDYPGYDPDNIPYPLAYMPGDVLVFWFNKVKWPRHAGIVSDRGIIHTYSEIGKVVEHGIDDQYWKPRIAKVYKFPGVEHFWSSEADPIIVENPNRNIHGCYGCGG